MEKAGSALEILSRQKEEIEQSNKKVIANLKDKIKGQTDRINDMQSQLV
jgi:prefoldin subunit 5